ncbi:EamA family transporter, partial [bacterium]|nr:EamA family transporter [bacterium]
MSIYIFLPIITAICWGIAQVLGKKSVQTLSVNNFNTVREFIAVIFSVTLMLTLSNLRFLTCSNTPYLIAAALISIVGTNLTLTFLYRAMKYGSVSVVVVALCSSPIFVFIYSYLFFDEGITYSLTVGIILILVAIVLVSFSKKTSIDEYRRSIVVPVVYATAAGACQSVMIVGNKILLKHLSYYDLYAVVSVVAFVGFLLLSRRKILLIFSKKQRHGTFYALLSGVAG